MFFDILSGVMIAYKLHISCNISKIRTFYTHAYLIAFLNIQVNAYTIYIYINLKKSIVIFHLVLQ